MSVNIETQPKPYTAKAVIKFFTELRKTHFTGRYYTIIALAYYTRAKTLGIDLKILGIEPIGFISEDIVVKGRKARNLIAAQKIKPKEKKEKGV